MDSGWWIILAPLFLMQLIIMLFVAGCIGFGLWKAWKAETAGVRTGWLLLAAIPFLLLVTRNFVAWRAESTRQQEIAAVERVSIKGQKFEHVIVFDGVNSSDTEAILALLQPRVIWSFEDGRKRLQKKPASPAIGKFIDNSDCRALVRNVLFYQKYLQALEATGVTKARQTSQVGKFSEMFYSDYTDRKGGHGPFPKVKSDDCITWSKGVVQRWEGLPRDALYIFSGHSTSFMESNELRGDRIEIRRFVGDELKLVDYREMALDRYNFGLDCLLMVVTCLGTSLSANGANPNLGMMLVDALYDPVVDNIHFDSGTDYYKLDREKGSLRPN
jgi:hypothetical protein